MFATRLVLLSHTHQSEEGSEFTPRSVQYMFLSSTVATGLQCHSFILMWQLVYRFAAEAPVKDRQLWSHFFLIKWCNNYICFKRIQNFLWKIYYFGCFVVTFLPNSDLKKKKSRIWLLHSITFMSKHLWPALPLLCYEILSVFVRCLHLKSCPNFPLVSVSPPSVPTHLPFSVLVWSIVLSG